MGRVIEGPPGTHAPVFPGHWPTSFWAFVLQPSPPAASGAGHGGHRDEKDLRLSHGLRVRLSLPGQAPSECEPPAWHKLAGEGNW